MIELTEEYGPDAMQRRFELGTDGPLLIVVGVDGSRTALRAGAYAAGLARRQRSRLVVVYVASPSVWTATMPDQVAAAQVETVAALIEEQRELIRGRAVEMGIPITFMVRRGDPFYELRQTAIELRADNVVVGSSEQAGHRLIGSIATRLVRAGHWPVTVVP
jgi:nucleotide-binding universal stress UspA family protein